MQTFNNLLFRNNPILNGVVSIGAIRSAEEIISSIYFQSDCLHSLWYDILLSYVTLDYTVLYYTILCLDIFYTILDEAVLKFFIPFVLVY